jgi:predicted RNA-binding Zn-ribbon protein involved in translation (DUF1610 family)
MKEETCTANCDACGMQVTFGPRDENVKCPHCGRDNIVQTEEYGRRRLNAEEPKQQRTTPDKDKL